MRVSAHHRVEGLDARSEKNERKISMKELSCVVAACAAVSQGQGNPNVPQTKNASEFRRRFESVKYLILRMSRLTARRRFVDGVHQL